MKIIKSTEILDYYDGIEIFAGLDEIGGSYLGVRCDMSGDHDSYIVVGVRPERLREFRSGVLDLRDLMLDAPGGEWFTVLADMEYGAPMPLVHQTTPLEKSDYLPLPGVTLDDLQIDDRVLAESRERNAIVFEFSVEPPEAAFGHRVRMYTLGGLLNVVQTLVKHACKSALRDRPQVYKDMMTDEDGDLMDVVVPAAGGSYRVMLESASQQRDLLGDNQLSRALSILDEMMEASEDPKRARESLKPYRGHLMGSYIKFIELLAERQTGFQYAWASPSSTEARRGGLSESTARTLSELFSETTDLSVVETTLTGELIRANRNSGSWALTTDDGNRAGVVDDRGPSLDGLTIGGRYSFVCREDVELGVTGEKTTYSLKSYQPA